MKNSGHPYYQFYDDINDYEKRCREQDKNGHKMLFGNDILVEDENCPNEEINSSESIIDDDDSDNS